MAIDGSVLHNGLSAVAAAGENTVVTEDVDPERAEPATMQLGDKYSTEVVKQPRDGRGGMQVWLSPLMDGEMDFHTVGVVWAAGRGELHAWQDFGDWVPWTVATHFSCERDPRPDRC